MVTDVRLGKPAALAAGLHTGLAARSPCQEQTGRGKYLWLPVGEGGLLLHLGMSGSLAFGEQLALPARTTTSI